MARKDPRNTRRKIVTAAWRLFYEQGYDSTTVDQIISASGTSKGSFYHYFTGKDALLSSLSLLFDSKYEELISEIDPGMNSFDKLILLNKELFFMIENTVSLELLTRMLSTQLNTVSERHLLDRSRFYFKLLRRICTEGQQRGELRDDIPVTEMIRSYALLERALMYDWCICGGTYSLSQDASVQLPRYLAYLKK